MKLSSSTLSRILTAVIATAALTGAIFITGCGPNKPDGGPRIPGGPDSSTSTTTTINATIGGACTDNTPCGADGTCIAQKADGTYNSGYCSADCSDSTKSCPTGSTCQTIDGAQKCMLTCGSGGATCRTPGYKCDTTLNVCVSESASTTTTINATIGGACTDDTPCGAEGTCITQKADGTYKGGYCSADCSDTTKSCPTGSTCQTIDHTKKCMLTCGSGGATCRTPGYKCEISRHICVSESASTGPVADVRGVGLPCKANGDCEGTEAICIIEKADGSFKGGYCSADCSSKSCPSFDSTCTTIDGAPRCARKCDSDLDCTAVTNVAGRYTCDLTKHVCLPPPTSPPAPQKDAEIKICEDDADCSKGLKCHQLFGSATDVSDDIKICTHECSSDPNSCPNNSACEPIVNQKLCLPTCDPSASTCKTDLNNTFVCGQPAAGSPNVCYMPLKDIGDACTSNDQCRGGALSRCYLYDPANNTGICQLGCLESTSCPKNYYCDNRKVNGLYGYCRPTCESQTECDNEFPGSQCISAIGPISSKNVYTVDPNVNVCYLTLKSNTSHAGAACDPLRDDCGPNSLCTYAWERSSTDAIEGGFCRSYVYDNEPCPSGTIPVRAFSPFPLEMDVSTYRFEDHMKVCAKPCTGSGDCRGTGYQCVKRVSTDAHAVCLPSPFYGDLP